MPCAWYLGSLKAERRQHTEIREGLRPFAELSGHQQGTDLPEPELLICVVGIVRIK